MSADGFSYVGEIKKGANYRTYMYENPDLKVVCPEAAEMLALMKIVADEYGAKSLSLSMDDRRKG